MAMAGFRNCNKKWRSYCHPSGGYTFYVDPTDKSRLWSDTSLQINETYTREGRFVRLFRFMMLGNGPPSISECNKYLRFCLRTEYEPRKANSLLAQMIVRGTIPDKQTFIHLLPFYCIRLTYHHVFDLVRAMKVMEVEADGSFYIFLLNKACARFGHNIGYELLRVLKLSYPLPLLCYNAVARRYCTRKMTEETAMILTDLVVDMKQHQVFPDERFYNWLLKAVAVDGGENANKAVSLGKLAFAEGIRVGAVSPLCKGALRLGFDKWTGLIFLSGPPL